MTFDIRPFWLIAALAATGFGLLVLIVKKAYPSYLGRVMTVWGVANLCLGAAFAIRFERALVGQFLFNVFSATLVITCLCLEYAAVSQLKRQPTRTGWVVAPPVLVFLVCLWFTFVERNISAELLFCNFVNLAMMCVIAWSLLWKEKDLRPFADRIAAAAYLLLALATSGVIVDFIRNAQFTPEYDFSRPRALFNVIAAILTEGIVFPLFLLMLSERLNQALLIQAMRDPLTGLYNRRAFEEIAYRELAGAVRSGSSLSVLMVDLDHFKRINDQYGHGAGDAVLDAAAVTLRGALRDEDFVCRWGGDEFCALLPRSKREQAEMAAERVRQAFERAEPQFEAEAARVTVSIGIAAGQAQTADIADMVRLADAALYRAKNEGRNRIVFAGDPAA